MVNLSLRIKVLKNCQLSILDYGRHIYNTLVNRLYTSIDIQQSIVAFHNSVYLEDLFKIAGLQSIQLHIAKECDFRVLYIYRFKIHSTANCREIVVVVSEISRSIVIIPIGDQKNNILYIEICFKLSAGSGFS